MGILLSFLHWVVDTIRCFLIVSAMSAAIGPALRAPIVGPLYGISASTTSTNSVRYAYAHFSSVCLSVYANLREVA